MNSRMSVPRSAGRFRFSCPALLAGLLVTFPPHNKAHADAAKASPWAAVMPGFEPGRITTPPDAVKASTARRSAALALFYKARRLEQEADDSQALQVYLEAAALDPGHPALTHRLVGLYTRTGRIKEALALLEKSVTQFPKDPGALLALARFLENHSQGDPEGQKRALRIAEQAVAKFPGSTAAIDYLMRLHLAAQRRVKAQAVIDTALRSSNKDPDYWLALVTPARHAYPLDDRETYARHFALVSTGIEKALTLAPDDPDVQETAGDFFARNRQPARALAMYEKVAARRPGDLKTRQKLGQLLRMAGREAEAIELFESLVRIDPGDTVSHKALVSLHEKNDPAKALTHRAELLRLESGDPRDYATTTHELLQAKRPVEALTLVKRGIFFNPQAPSLLYLQARVLSEKGDQAAALASLGEAETLARDKQPKLLDSAFYYSWGAVALKAGNPGEAEARYRQSIELAPPGEPQRAAPAYNDLAWLWLTQNKNVDAAGELLRTANDLVKDHGPYLDSLGWYYFLKKDYPTAVQHLRRAVALTQPHPPQELLDHLAKAEEAAAAK